jgi:hypothetical protein
VWGFGEEWGKLGTFGKNVLGSAFSAGKWKGTGGRVLEERGARVRAAVGSFCNGAKKVRRVLVGEGFVRSILRVVVGGKRAGWWECCVDLRGGRFACMWSIDVAEFLMFLAYEYHRSEHFEVEEVAGAVRKVFGIRRLECLKKVGDFCHRGFGDMGLFPYFNVIY